jgi:hypothetical protein
VTSRSVSPGDIIAAKESLVEFGRRMARDRLIAGRALLLERFAELYRRALQIGTPRILDAAELAEVREASRRHSYEGGGI